ncbi:hypothetical protein CGCA056_v003479 [Colletotrichum aenigma]|uniref:uncharacterized protein n=1 Tax=Colletotrichum aenigma TaxID=1215731 RepID=UPI00187219FB|nr:uncharacterized protein CGCA056_v003479 [Colletotrichum aenigma]KAF5526370.1 hypothetical protein CGCA056_v003479 [Colletotrichum aenigma]
MDQPTESVVISIRMDGASAYDPDAGVDAIATTIPSFCRGCNAATTHNDIPAIQRAWKKFEEVESSASWEEIIVKGGIGPWDRIKAARDAADAEVVRAEARVEELTKALEIARSKRECAVERLKGADDYLEQVVGTVASDSGRLEEKFAEMTSGGIDLYNLWASCPTGMPYKMIDRIDKRLHDVFDTLQSTTRITGMSYEYPADAPQLSRPAVFATESSNTAAEQSNIRTPTPSEKNSGNNQDRRRGKGKHNKKRRNDSRAQPYPTSAKQHRGTKQRAAMRSELPKQAEPTTNVKREVAEEPTTSVGNQSKPSTTTSGPVQHLQTLVKQEDAQLDQIPFKTETRAQPLEGMGSSSLSYESECQRADESHLRHIAGGANQTSNGINDGGLMEFRGENPKKPT